MRIRYGKPIKVKSLVGKQDVLTFNSQGENISYIGVGNCQCVKNGSAYIRNIGAGVNVSLNSEHKYFILIQLKGGLANTAFNIYYANDDTQLSLDATQYKNLQDKVVCALLTNETKFRASHLYSYRSSFDTTSFADYYFLIDLTEIGLDNLTAQEFYNKYNQYFPLIATGEEITIDDKAGQVSYDKKVILQSLWGDQSNLISVQPSVSGNYKYLGKGGYSTQSTYNINTNLEGFNTPITNGHKYILILYHNGTSAYHMISTTNSDKWKWTTSGNIIPGQLSYCYYVADADIILKNFYQGGSGTPILYKDFFIDLTDTFGAGNEPTATEFYNTYKGYFLALTKGEKVIVGKGEVAGGSSDIYYGYNQKINPFSIVANECSRTYDDVNNELTLTATSSTTHSYFGASCGGFSQGTVQGHKVLCIGYLESLSITNTFTTFSFDWALTSITDYNRPSTAGNWVYGLGTWRDNATANYFNINGATPVVGDWFKITNVQIIDLKEWFGAGNEPATVAEFKEKFTKEYYGYCPTPIKLTRYQIEALPSYGYNQICYNGDFDITTGTTGWFMQNGTLSFSNNICSFSPTNITTSKYVRLTQRMTTRVMPIQGHIYYMNCKVKSNINLPINAFQYAIGPTSVNCNSVEIIKNTWYEFPKIVTVSSSVPSDGYLTINVYQGNMTLTEPYTVDVMRANLIDLTDWYGEGNEPTTVEEFKATFPNKYYPYSKKRLLNKYMINKLRN